MTSMSRLAESTDATFSAEVMTVSRPPVSSVLISRAKYCTVVPEAMMIESLGSMSFTASRAMAVFSAGN